MATFDTSFYGQAKAPEIADPVKQYATLAQLRMLQTQGANANLELQQNQQKFARENTLRDLYRQAGSDQNKLRQSLAAGGFIPELQALDKQRLQTEELQAKTAKEQAEAQRIKAAQFRDLAAQQTPDEAGYQRFIAQASQVFGQGAAAGFPAYTPDWQQRAITTADKKFEANKPIMKEVDDGQRKFFIDVNPASNPAIREFAAQMQMTPAQVAQDARALQQLAEQMRHNRSTEGISAGNLALSRERLNMDRDNARRTYDSERGLVVDTRTGQAEPVVSGGAPIGAKDKSSEAERSSAGYAGRMQNAENILSKLPPSADRPGIIEKANRSIGAETAANVSMSPQRQQYRQAQEDWVRAKLRKESGAVIGEQEMDREIQTYFPQIGDSRQVVAQKAQARAQAMEQLRSSAGRAAIPAPVSGARQPSNRPPLESFGR